jgi:hypothetical protein
MSEAQRVGLFTQLGGGSHGRMSAVGFVFGVFGLLAFVRLERLARELKAKGILDSDYKD